MLAYFSLEYRWILNLKCKRNLHPNSGDCWDVPCMPNFSISVCESAGLCFITRSCKRGAMASTASSMWKKEAHYVKWSGHLYQLLSCWDKNHNVLKWFCLRDFDCHLCYCFWEKCFPKMLNRPGVWISASIRFLQISEWNLKSMMAAMSHFLSRSQQWQLETMWRGCCRLISAKCRM